MAKEKTYSQDVDAAVAAGATLGTITLSKKGADGKTYNQDTREFASPFTVEQMLAFCGNSVDEMGTLFVNRVVNPMIQVRDRNALKTKAEGPQRVIDDMVDSLLDGKAFDNKAEATDFVITRLKAQGVLPADYVAAA